MRSLFIRYKIINIVKIIIIDEIIIYVLHQNLLFIILKPENWLFMYIKKNMLVVSFQINFNLTELKIKLGELLT